MPHSKEVRTFKHFAEFVASPLPDGLGSDLDTIKRMIGASMEPEAAKAADLLDEVNESRQGQRTDLVEKEEENANNFGNNVTEVKKGRPEGNSSEKALRRLRKSRPDLHKQVLANQVTPHAAMVEAGFRPKTITLPLDVEKAAAAIRRHFSAEREAWGDKRSEDYHCGNIATMIENERAPAARDIAGKIVSVLGREFA